MDRTADIAWMKTQMEEGIPQEELDTVALKSADRTLTFNQLMNEVEDQTPLGIQLLNSFLSFQQIGDTVLPEGWEVVESSLVQAQPEETN